MDDVRTIDVTLKNTHLIHMDASFNLENSNFII